MSSIVSTLLHSVTILGAAAFVLWCFAKNDAFHSLKTHDCCVTIGDSKRAILKPSADQVLPPKTRLEFLITCLGIKDLARVVDKYAETAKSRPRNITVLFPDIYINIYTHERISKSKLTRVKYPSHYVDAWLIRINYTNGRFQHGIRLKGHGF